MPNHPDERFIFNENVDADFLDGGLLWACFLCPPGPDQSLMDMDTSRPDAVAMTLAMLSPELDGWSKLSRITGGKPALVVLPELAFGSVDWNAIDSAVRSGRNSLIVIAGFGFTTGRAILDGIANNDWKPSWDGVPPLEPTGRFNGAWVWVHLPGESTRCIVVLKNWPEQTTERAAVPNWMGGTHYLRLAARDLVLYPVICFDLVHQAPGSACERICNTLEGGQRVVVVTVAHDSHPYNDNWDSAIKSLTDFTWSGSLIVLKNNGVPARLLDQDELKDRWRQGSGAFISRRVVPVPPLVPLRHVRFVRRDASGFVLREVGPCVAIGRLAWTNNSVTAKGGWGPITRLEWRDCQLSESLQSIEGVEFGRLLDRLTPDWDLSECKAEVKAWLSTARSTIKEHYFSVEGDQRWSQYFLCSIFDGLGPGTSRNPDEIDKWRNSFLAASRSLAAISAAISHTPILDALFQRELISLQVHSNTWRILVWHSPEKTTRSMQTIARKLTESNSSTPPLVIVGGSTKVEGKPAPLGRLERPRSADLPAPEQGAKDIRVPQDSAIYWVPTTDVEQVLIDAGTTGDAVDGLFRLLCEPEDIYV